MQTGCDVQTMVVLSNFIDVMRIQHETAARTYHSDTLFTTKFRLKFLAILSKKELGQIFRMKASKVLKTKLLYTNWHLYLEFIKFFVSVIYFCTQEVGYVKFFILSIFLPKILKRH